MTAKNLCEADYIAKMRPQDILIPGAAGLCCKPGGFYIDPVRPVERAVITHGHSDHARSGHGAVLATQETLDMMRLRYGDNFAGRTQAIAYGEELKLGDVTIKFHPAGHVLGSAQIAVSCKDTCVVASGDYKDAPDPTCAPFEAVPCDVFITEATFGLPVFRHGDAADEINKLLASVALFPERAHLVGAYSLGKARWKRSRATTRAAAWSSASCAWSRASRRPISPAPSRWRRHRPRQTSGRGGFPIRSPRLHRAGCGCGHGPASAASNCRW